MLCDFARPLEAQNLAISDFVEARKTIEAVSITKKI
jgi:hypothetical protein